MDLHHLLLAGLPAHSVYGLTRHRPHAALLFVDIGADTLHSGSNSGGETMAKKRRISDGATFGEVQALLLKCTRQLRALMPPGADLSHLDDIEARMAYLTLLRQAQPARLGGAQTVRFLLQ
jgi:hypothetical protein